MDQIATRDASVHRAVRRWGKGREKKSSNSGGAACLLLNIQLSSQTDRIYSWSVGGIGEWDAACQPSGSVTSVDWRRQKDNKSRWVGRWLVHQILERDFF